MSERVAAATELLAFLFGSFCALWTQNTVRGAWAWFVLGCLFGPFTVVVLLLKNARQRSVKHGTS